MPDLGFELGASCTAYSYCYCGLARPHKSNIVTYSTSTLRPPVVKVRKLTVNHCRQLLNIHFNSMMTRRLAVANKDRASAFVSQYFWSGSGGSMVDPLKILLSPSLITICRLKYGCCLSYRVGLGIFWGIWVVFYPKEIRLSLRVLPCQIWSLKVKPYGRNLRRSHNFGRWGPSLLR